MTAAGDGETIWFAPVDAAKLNRHSEGCMPGKLGITIDEVGPDWLRGSMPVNDLTRQPYGLLHGGASCVLSETLGSIASTLVLDTTKEIALGQTIDASHVRGVRDGRVYGVTRPEHLGRRSHVWTTHIYDAKDRVVCISRLTVAVVERRDG